MVIQSLGLELRTRIICHGVKVKVNGVVFWADLIILDSQGLDVILRMDWLAKHKDHIDCANKAITLTSAQGTRVDFMSNILLPHHSTLNILTDPKLYEIPIVFEYLDVFPKELLGTPLDRDIKYVIELLPRTSPISKRSYWIPVNELAKSKKQLRKLQVVVAKRAARHGPGPGLHNPFRHGSLRPAK